MAPRDHEGGTSRAPDGPKSAPPRVGTIVHRARRQQGWTLEELAARSGVSRSMLSQIERDRTNPTFGTVWKLTEALGIRLEEVLPSPQAHTGLGVLREYATPVLSSADRKCTLRILGPIELAGNFEWYELRAERGGLLKSDPHDIGAVEHLTVLEGTFTVESGDHSAVVNAGETIRYRGDLAHAVINRASEVSRCVIVVTRGAPRARR